MKSDVIFIDNRGSGFDQAVEQARRVAVFRDLDRRESLRLQLCAEEMLNMIRSVTGELKASFWIESEGDQCTMHLSTQTVMDQEKRTALLSAATSRTNENARSFLGWLRDQFEMAMAGEPNRDGGVPDDILSDLANRDIVERPEWDGFERSTLRILSDHISIGIRGGQVDMTVTRSLKK